MVTCKKLAKKTFLLKASQDCRYLNYVHSGALRSYYIDKDGKESTIMFAIADWWITDIYSYMSPGSVTEILHFFIAEYAKTMKVGHGGGIEEEEENIEVLEIDIDQAFEMINTGEIKDAKTIMLLQYMQISSLI